MPGNATEAWQADLQQRVLDGLGDAPTDSDRKLALAALDEIISAQLPQGVPAQAVRAQIRAHAMSMFLACLRGGLRPAVARGIFAGEAALWPE